MKKRIFIAVDLDRELRESIYGYASKNFSRLVKARITDVSNLHITVKFIGNTDEEKLGEIKDILSESVAGHERFVYELERQVGAFPGAGRARIVFIGLSRGRERLKALYRSIEGGLSGLGINKDQRDYHPHVTIARMKIPADISKIIEEPVSFQKIPLNAEAVTLYESVLSSRGARYINMGRFVLK